MDSEKEQASAANELKGRHSVIKYILVILFLKITVSRFFVL